METSPTALDEDERQIALEHSRYTTTTSSPEAAVSLETSLLLFRIVRLEGYRRVADLGSGFSSYVLRRALVSPRAGDLVHSVENSPVWLEATRRFLLSKGETGGWLTDLEGFPGIEQGAPFDLIFHDLGGIDERIRLLPEILKLLHPRGTLIVDDIQKARLRDAVVAACSTSYSIVDLSAPTRDRFDRYAWAIRCRTDRHAHR